MSALALLKQDHAKVKKLFRDFGRTTERAVKTRRRLIDQIATELDVHAQIEEEIFYPAVEKLPSVRSLVKEAHEEHAQVKKLVAEIQGMNPSDERLARRVRELREAVLHHASQEEEQRMFPEVREQLDQEKLNRLGDELRARKQALLRGVMGRVKRAVKKGLRKVA